MCLDGEGSGEDQQVLRADFQFFGFGKFDGFGVEEAGCPGEFQGDDELVFRLVAVDVEAGQDNDLQGLGDGCAALDGDGVRRTDSDFILLG